MFKSVDPKPDFPALEKDLLKKWENSSLVAKYLQKNNQASEKYSFLDGPITANNPMGVHHAWGRTYKDLWQRFHNMLGYKQRFQNGFDEQGLWVEVEVEKELGLNSKKEIEDLVPGDKEKSIAQFINLCKERVKKYAGIQTEQSKRLGYFMDWDNSYHTSSDENNYAIWNFLKKVWTDGNLYKGHDTVPWCPRCGTAISQHEILTEEYKEINHDTVFFKLPVLNKDFSLVAWTTTPWTIPANVALAVNPKYKYKIWKLPSGEKIVTVDQSEIKQTNQEEYDWFNKFVMETGLEGVAEITGNDLVGLEYAAPFDQLPAVQKSQSENPNTFHRVIAAEDLVTSSKGTGILHVAPGAGEEDFRLSKEHNLSVIAPIDEDATYYEGFGEFSKQNAKQKPGLIIKYLETLDNGKFFWKTQQIVHRYPTCWRCKSELVWRVVDEWYISVDKRDGKGRDLRGEMIAVAKKVKWIPSWGKERELDWLQNMHDWLISKKRYWGLALPIYECSQCHHFEVIGSKEELKERASEGWDNFDGNSPHRPWIDHVKITCSKCSATVSRIQDVGNPWLDAGIVPFSTLPQEWFPADLVGESFPGQFKNWFYSMIAMATVLKGEPPFKTLFGYAAMKDEKGEEMHKSKGNAIWFDDGAEKIGVDVMRWLFVTHNPENNLPFGYNVTDQVRRQFLLMLWNVYKFFVDYANADGFTSRKPQLPNSTNVLDIWILQRLTGLIGTMTKELQKYDMMTAYRNAQSFLEDLSVWYLRRSRDRVGPGAIDEKDKENFYQTMHFVLATYTTLLAPAVPFISEIIYTNLTGEESVHLNSWPTEPVISNSEILTQMALLREVVEKSHSQRKDNNLKVRQPLASLTYQCDKQLPSELEAVLRDELNVKKVHYQKAAEVGVSLDTNLTESLKEEGMAREIVRQVQEERKKVGVNLTDQVLVTLPSWPEKFTDYIKQETLAKEIQKGETLQVRL